MTYRVLDAFCCAGGTTRGLQLAGFHVTGVDVVKHAEYCGDAFVEGDAIEYIEAHGHEYDAIVAGPPCQSSSALTRGNRKRKTTKVPSSHGHVNLIPQTRRALAATGKPYIIENVQGSELRRDVTLCGLMFDLKVFRHRYFEMGNGAPIAAPAHRPHAGHRVAGWRHGVKYDGDMVAVYGDGGGKGSLADWQAAMGIDWITDKALIAEAIPPAYFHYLGGLLLQHLSATPSQLPSSPKAAS